MELQYPNQLARLVEGRDLKSTRNNYGKLPWCSIPAWLSLLRLEENRWLTRLRGAFWTEPYEILLQLAILMSWTIRVFHPQKTWTATSLWEVAMASSPTDYKLRVVVSVKRP